LPLQYLLKKTDQTNVIRQTNWRQLGGKKPSLLRYSDGCLPKNLTDGYRRSLLACVINLARVRFFMRSAPAI